MALPYSAKQWLLSHGLDDATVKFLTAAIKDAASDEWHDILEPYDVDPKICQMVIDLLRGKKVDIPSPSPPKSSSQPLPTSSSPASSSSSMPSSFSAAASASTAPEKAEPVATLEAKHALVEVPMQEPSSSPEFEHFEHGVQISTLSGEVYDIELYGPTKVHEIMRDVEAMLGFQGGTCKLLHDGLVLCWKDLIPTDCGACLTAILDEDALALKAHEEEMRAQLQAREAAQSKCPTAALRALRAEEKAKKQATSAKPTTFKLHSAVQGAKEPQGVKKKSSSFVERYAARSQKK